jgi:hypothetical protein
LPSKEEKIIIVYENEKTNLPITLEKEKNVKQTIGDDLESVLESKK